MRNAIGFVIVLWALSKFFTATFDAFDSAAAETLKSVELAAEISQVRMLEK